MKIAHVITCLSAHGAETMLVKLLQRMDCRKFQPEVFSLTGDGPLRSAIEALGIPVRNCGMGAGLSAASGMVNLVAGLRRFQPDLIQGWMYHGNLAAQLGGAFLSSRVPVLWNIRGCHHRLKEEKWSTAATIWLGARLSSLPVRIVNNSWASVRLHEQHLGFSPGHWEVVPNGFDLDRFVPSGQARRDVRRELGIAQNKLLVGLFARYDKVKDHMSFLKSAARLRKQHESAEFVLAGECVNVQNRDLMQLIGALRLNDGVHMVGERTDMPRLLAAMDLVVSSSSSEGFPNVIGEAMSCGVPCVVTDVGDSAWLLGEAGLVVPPRDTEALALACAELLQRGAAAMWRLGLAGRERIARLFSIAAVAARYEQIYDRILTEAAGGKEYRRCAA
ncbi:MAG: glycosyltransferase [Bryobacteraceae bacterium]